MDKNNENRLPIDKLDKLNDDQLLSLKGGHCDDKMKKEEDDKVSGPGCGCGCGCGC